jgi:transposase
MDQSSSLLLGIDGLVVESVLIDESGRRVVHCTTDPELAGWCPKCRQQSSSPKERVVTRPRDLRIGPDRPVLLWHKHKWHCRVQECERKVFTDALPEQIPARARITTRARRAAAVSIGDHGRPVSGVAAEFGMDWRIAHDAFVAYAEQVLPAGPPPVRVLGIDETRRGKGRYEIQTSTGVKVWVDRFDTGLVDLEGTGGLFAQVNGRTSASVIAWLDHGRTSASVIAWLDQQDPQWRAAITHVSMDTSATYARAARLALPNATVIVDRFHLVALANRAVTEYRRELAWSRRGRRGRKSDPEWAQRNRLLRAAETLTAEETAKLHAAMRAADPSGGLEKCWQGKEMLRSLLALAGTTPDRGVIWTRLTDFYLHCADSGIHQLRLAWTVNAWQPSIIAGIHTGISNGRTEGYNRIVKHVGRIAFGFRNTENQKRRIRFACTRASRRAPTRTLKPC